MESNKLILSLLTSGTSTKVACFRNKSQIFEETVIHDTNGLTQTENIWYQLDLIKSNIMASLNKSMIDLGLLKFIITKGGVLKPLQSGVYYVNSKMINDITKPSSFLHINNIGTLLAKSMATDLNIPCYVAEPDSFYDSKIVPQKLDASNVTSQVLVNSLIHKGLAQKSTLLIGKNYRDLNLVTALLDNEVSIAVHKMSQIVDTREILSPTTPEMIVDGKIIDEKLKANDHNTKTSIELLLNTVTKEIINLATSLNGEIDGIILTGEMTKSELLLKSFSESIGYIGSIFVFPTENEMDYLLDYGSQILLNTTEPQEYK